MQIISVHSAEESLSS